MAQSFTNQVFDRSKSRVPERLVLLALAWHADRKVHRTPTIDWLQRMTRLPKKRVRQALETLCLAGEISIEDRVDVTHVCRITLGSLESSAFTMRRQPCPKCGWDEGPLHVHHIKPLAEGGKDEPANRQSLCPNCHSLEHLRRNQEELNGVD